ncbi:hypothetical protein [Streptomyces longwoodensis]|uniref:hypothetical protein n=1 Tax=Streptomyces longwoodensis TaxID=68231 RepID=UPI00224D810F|nr:hypothetical protein [Streptomyces longwoodensis]MCX5000936.1 hypothetical protein [Streptomyces longwoodensis]
MGDGDESQDTAARRLRQLNAYFREHPVRGPEGHSYTRFSAHASTTAPGIPFNTRVSEHIDASVTEVVAHTRAANPDAGPAPTRADAVYDWAREHTRNAPEAEQFRRDMLEYRHYLEHAIAAGDTSVVRPHRCPDCRTVGLFWQEERGTVICFNRRCAQANGGIHRTHSLARLAFEHVALQRRLQACAT